MIPILDGDVTLDGTADTRGTLALTTDGNGWDPRPGHHLLQPYGIELFIERGVEVGGSTEWVSQGYFRASSVTQDAGPDGPLTIAGDDRMQGLIDAQLIAPVQFPATASVADVFTALVTGVYPLAHIDFDWTASADLLGAAQVTQADRHGFLNDLAISRGKIMYWDYRGRLQVRSRPNPGVVVWDVNAGAYGVLVSASWTLTRDNVYNAVVVQADGADTTAPALAAAYDNSKASPTYYYGTFGKIPVTWSSPTITTQAQAAAAAKSLLAKANALPLQADFTAVPNPALEPGDVISLTWPAGTPPDSPLVLDSVTIPLTAAAALTATAHNPATDAAAIILGGTPA